MDPDLSPDQRLLRETTERFIEANLPLDKLRELIDAGGQVGPSYWRDGAELGWFAFLAPESLGGGSVSGDGVLDAVILAELRGRYLQPGTFIDTNLAVATLAREGSEEQRAKVVPTLISGEAAVAWAVADPAGDWSGSAGVDCEPTRGGYRLTGRKGLVVEAQSAQWLLVTAAAPDGPTQFLLPTATPGVTVEVLTGLDLSRRLCEVHFDDVEVDGSALVGTLGGAAAAVDAQLLLAGVLATAETVGAMQHLFDLTVQYCKDRVAFGRPIGSFQAVKHQLADTSLALEMSHAVASGAAREAQQDGRGAAHAASMAKAFVGDAAVELAHKCWQLFGGIAYTWEHDFHLYLRRLTTDASLYGSPAWHRERICQLAGL
ncbi:MULTISPECIES: acyl-CoA dehydrogenase family protein [Pseudofrankia]|uniref:acyl-CoA dehydrogenase family protein n=1 Tax=Pseudofrankia TaxID=2994363 RepID=UPI000234CA6F|nr:MULTISPECIES: acyl-CoA dehydrogenase family protein [Pseudofrankia]OHV39180.1 acyl-CoA dehydrogenase [Pseudofrankia sp. EUN1h]